MTNSEVKQPIQFSIARLLMMGVTSVLLCLSFLMSVFTPYPLALSSILYGRNLGIAVAVFASIVCFFVASSLFQDLFLFIFYILAATMALLIAEVIRRDIDPMKGILSIGVSATVLASSALFMTVQVHDKSIKELLVTEFSRIAPLLEAQVKKIKATGTGNTQEIEALLSDPNLLAIEAIKQVPSFFLIGLFVMLWLNTFLMLKSNRLLVMKDNAKFSELDLLKFRMPEYFIWGVVLALICLIWGEGLNLWLPAVGMTLLKVLGVFYFFQGFGIYIGFLDHIKLKGFFRTLLIVLTVLTANQAIAIIGLFDMFVNFKKFFKEKNN